MMTRELPRELVFMIIRKLDVDTRRSLGIYTKICISKSIIDKIEKVSKKTERYYNNEIVTLDIAPHVHYKLIKCFQDDKMEQMLDYRIFHERPSSISIYMIWSFLDE